MGADAEAKLMDMIIKRLDGLDKKVDALIKNTGTDRTLLALVRQKVGIYATGITLGVNAIIGLVVWTVTWVLGKGSP